jgi:hypothetical protein
MVTFNHGENRRKIDLLNVLGLRFLRVFTRHSQAGIHKAITMHSQGIHRVWDDGGEVDNDGLEVEDDGSVLEVEDDGGVLEVDDSVLRGQGRWATCLRSMAVCSGWGMRRRHAPRPRSRQWRALRPKRRQRCALGPGSRTTTSGNAAVSRVTEGQALGDFKKLLSVVIESKGTKNFRHGHLMRDMAVLHMSPFSSYGRCT